MNAAARLRVRELGPGLRRLRAACPTSPTMRRIPWLEKTALVLCDLVDEETGEPVEVSPRRILQRQVERAAAAGLHASSSARELEFFLFKDSLDEAAAKRLPRTSRRTRLSSRTTTSSRRPATSTSSAQIRNGIDGAGVPVEFSKGEAGKGQHEINLVYADALEMADRHVDLQERREGDRRRSTAARSRSWRSTRWTRSARRATCTRACGTRRPATAADVGRRRAPTTSRTCSAAGSAASSRRGRELAWMFAPTVNSYKRYQPESWAPTALAWGVDNRTCGFRLVGHGRVVPASSRASPAPT